MILEAREVSLVYRDYGKDVYACRNSSVTISPGEFVGILGPSGSGKSSLLYLLSGLKVPSSGQILVDGRDLTSLSDEERSNLRLQIFGFVFQQPYLLGYLTALENVLVSSPNKLLFDRANELLANLGLAEKAHRKPHELSGGERQRVCVARALLHEPAIIFADEPTASLDHTNGVNVVELLDQFRGNGSLVMVTHDKTMLSRATRILEIVEGEVQGQA